MLKKSKSIVLNYQIKKNMRLKKKRNFENKDKRANIQ